MATNPKITDWNGKRVWLVGASTGIGAALARDLARRGARLALSSRNGDKLRALNIHGALILPCDATNSVSLTAARLSLCSAFGGVDLVIYLAGDYAPMQADSFDIEAAEKIFEVNFLGAARLGATVFSDLQAGGGIAFVASIAGYRGLPRALAYGPGKAALINFAESLYFDLAPKRIGVWCINPGFVATRLTDKNDFDMPALITPDQAAGEIVKGFRSGRFEIHFPKRFSWAMKLVAHLPYRLFFALVARITGKQK
jgi:short-subunit dehydrogenase